MAHVLVTNDFPPKIGGIQSYLWELWRRLPPDRVTVLTTPYAGDVEFDDAQPYRVERARQRVLWPTPALTQQIRDLADEVGAGLVVLDPALPLSLVGRHLRRPYAVVVHGAEVSVPGRLPGGQAALRQVLRGASLVIACGEFVLSEVYRAAGGQVPSVIVPPGVDLARFRPLSDDERAAGRALYGLPPEGKVVVALTRLVPRKGIDVLIAASSLLMSRHPDLTLVVGGTGRDAPRLARLASKTGAPVRFLGRLSEDRLPTFLGCADVFAMPCRNRWGGLEQEGFGIVFLEAAACGIPQVAGLSGGSAEAVTHGESGLVVRSPEDPVRVAGALDALLDDEQLRTRLGRGARRRAEERFDYDHLAQLLDQSLQAVE
ncbi:MAG: glycosyltransferase family 4 protein [Acidimicrobiales bacterium]